MVQFAQPLITTNLLPVKLLPVKLLPVKLLTATLLTATLLAPTLAPAAAQAQTIIYRSVSPIERDDYYEDRRYDRHDYYPHVSGPSPRIWRRNIDASVIVRPVIIDSTIENSTIVNPVIVSPRRSRSAVTPVTPVTPSVTHERSFSQSNPACMAFSEIRIACQP
jgi:hypothetical protein